MKERLYVDLIGQAGTGKSTVSQYLAEQHDFHIFRPSDLVRKYAGQHNIPPRDRQDYIDCHLAKLK